MARAAPWTRSRWLAGALVVAATLPFYAPLLGRAFTSEDYLLIRLALERPPWEDLAALVAGPWLGIEVVRFYRPVAQVLLAVEAWSFGANPVPYNLVHLVFHTGNALLVHHLAARLAPGRWPATGAALLFVLHPFHPNAVSFIASYATLFAATALLGSAVAWEAWRARPTGAPALLALAVLLYAAATACYEAAVALPPALLLRELLVPDSPPGAPLRRRLAATSPFFVVGGLYLWLRSAIFGPVLAGYDATAERWTADGWGRLATDALVAVQRLFHPVFDPPRPEWAAPTVLGLAASLPILLAVFRPTAWRRELGTWLFAWSWTILFLAPFAFQPSVPATGRFAYLAAVGAALALGQLARTAWAGRRTPGGRAVVSWAALALVAAIGALWATELSGAVGDMRRAGATAHRVRTELAAFATAAPAGPLLVANHPRFLFNEAGVPLAQVLRYGLADSVEPPFTSPGSPIAERPRIYPLPEGPIDGARAAFAAAPGSMEATFVAWDARAGVFRRRPARGTRSVPSIAVTGLGELSSPGPWELRYRPVPGARHRLVVLARGNPAVIRLGRPARPAAGGGAVAPVPAEFVRSMRRLYSGPIFGGPVYCWIEARDAAGVLVGASRVLIWPTEGPQKRSTSPLVK